MKQRHMSIPKVHKPKKTIDYFTPKRAFDSVMSAYSPEAHVDLFGTMETRSMSRIRIDVERFKDIAFYNEVPKRDPNKKRGQGTLAAKGVPVRNPTAPNITDFHVDVWRLVLKVVRNPHHLAKFIVRYLYEKENLTKIEQHLFSRYEQQLGRLFIRNHIYPVNKYFICIREAR